MEPPRYALGVARGRGSSNQGHCEDVSLGQRVSDLCLDSRRRLPTDPQCNQMDIDKSRPVSSEASGRADQLAVLFHLFAGQWNDTELPHFSATNRTVRSVRS
jgi:hypothetical protein